VKASTRTEPDCTYLAWAQDQFTSRAWLVLSHLPSSHDPCAPTPYLTRTSSHHYRLCWEHINCSSTI